ncbi:MAG: sugar phosphate nucleotidyltransferase, partial [Candidatus Bathyarchaeia archaeon]
MKAVVLAAGEGVRMRPITLTRPKHMIPVAGKPFVEYLLRALKGAGVSEILMVVGYGRDLIESYFGDGSGWGLDLAYVPQEAVRGTAHAIGLAEEYVGKEAFVAVYGDLLISSDVVESALKAHRRRGLVTMTVVPVEEEERYGVVSVKDGYVVDVVEKPQRGAAPSNLANAGVFVFTEDVFKGIRRTQRSVREELEITETLRLLVEGGERVVPVRVSPEEWMDIGRPWDLLEANRRILEDLKPEVWGDVEEGARIIGPVGVARGVRIRSGAYIVGPV